MTALAKPLAMLASEVPVLVKLTGAAEPIFSEYSAPLTASSPLSWSCRPPSVVGVSRTESSPLARCCTVKLIWAAWAPDPLNVMVSPDADTTMFVMLGRAKTKADASVEREVTEPPASV
jgi:hypothetical protein